MSEGKFVLTFRIPPPAGRTLLVRSGGTAFFAGFSKWWGWEMIANGRTEAIEEPTWWFLSPAIASELAVAPQMFGDVERLPSVTRRGQFLLDLSDSKTLSQRLRAA